MSTFIPTLLYTQPTDELENAIAGELKLMDPEEELARLAIASAILESGAVPTGAIDENS